MKSLILKDLESLCFCCGCANQASIASLAIELVRPYVDEVYTDSLGNVIAVRQADDPAAKTVMLEAHMDEIGFLVTHIDDAGFVHVAAAGGVDARVMAAQPVVVFGMQPYDGVVCSVPPHLSGGEKPLPTIEEIGIDIGMSADEARRCVPLGSRVAFAPNFAFINDRLVCSKSLDNRSGMAAILHCLRQLSTRAVRVAVVFCVQEELGCRGAAVATRQIQPDVAIVTDVSFAKAHGEDFTLCGSLGDGVMIGISPVLDVALSERLFAIATEETIPYQTEVMASTTGTDADQISIVDNGVPCALLSIPLRYMHTPQEMIDINDVVAVADIMTQYIEGGICG